MKGFKSSLWVIFGAVCFVCVSYYKVEALEFGEEGVCICEYENIITYPCCCNNYKSEEDKCILECPCYNGATCDENAEGCQCVVGLWGGDNCTDCVIEGMCNDFCKHCFNGEICRSFDDIDCDCTEGWDGELCDVCKTVGYYGDGCVKCEAGYYGDGCSYPCQCFNGATTCDHITGVCECPDGWMANDCSVCDATDQPSLCKDRCQNCYNGHWCSPVEGDCWCASGWTGPDCTVPCQEGYYGDDCQKECECYNGANCDRFTGECNCTSMWDGQHCTDCVSSSGNNVCTQYCFHCTNGEECYPVSELPVPCECSPGWMNDYCSRSCLEGLYGVGCSKECHCYNGGTCDHVTGACKCVSEWIGEDCTVCNEDVYGVTCDLQCYHCTNGEECRNNPNIPCECTAGYSGTKCENQFNCLETCYNGAIGCDSEGRCICASGWTGDLCTTCDPTTDNDLCEDTCRNCYNGDTCYPKTTSNVCDCTLGWTGAFCDTCPPGTYGDGCQKTCDCSPNALCDPVNGTCTCPPNFVGEDCVTLVVTSVVPVTNQTSGTFSPANAQLSSFIIIGAFVGCALVIVLLVTLLLCLLWRRKRNQRQHQALSDVKVEFSNENNEIAALKDQDIHNYQKLLANHESIGSAPKDSENYEAVEDNKLMEPKENCHYENIESQEDDSYENI